MQEAKVTTGLVQRFVQNPLLRPSDLEPSQPGWKIECLLNPGVFRFQDRIWLLVRVAERPPQQEGRVTFPILSAKGVPQLLEFDENDPRLDRSDPRVLRYDGTDYLTTLSHLRLLASEDGIHFFESGKTIPLQGHGPFETYGIEDCRVAHADGAYYLGYSGNLVAGLRQEEKKLLE